MCFAGFLLPCFNALFAGGFGAMPVKVQERRDRLGHAFNQPGDLP
jgi:hypothetical protein